MEGQWPPTGSDTLHICYWRKPYWFCWQKNYECAGHSAGLAVDHYLYYPDHITVAHGGFVCQYIFWTIPVFFKLYKEDRGENGNS